jgi:hypothetical protein
MGRAADTASTAADYASSVVAEAGAAVAANRAASTHYKEVGRALEPAQWMSSYMLAGEVEYAL